jgi:hypothetical protein
VADTPVVSPVMPVALAADTAAAATAN